MECVNFLKETKQDLIDVLKGKDVEEIVDILVKSHINQCKYHYCNKCLDTEGEYLAFSNEHNRTCEELCRDGYCVQINRLLINPLIYITNEKRISE